MGAAGQSEMDGNPTVLASTQIKEFRSLLAELDECRKLLAEAKS
jgi:hypothetical protein